MRYTFSLLLILLTIHAGISGEPGKIKNSLAKDHRRVASFPILIQVPADYQPAVAWVGFQNKSDGSKIVCLRQKETLENKLKSLMTKHGAYSSEKVSMTDYNINDIPVKLLRIKNAGGETNMPEYYLLTELKGELYTIEFFPEPKTPETVCKKILLSVYFE